MCHYYYLLCWSELQRFQFISTCFEEASLTPTLIQKQKHIPSPWQDLKAKGPNKTGLVSKKKKKRLAHREAMDRIRQTDPPLSKIQWGFHKTKLHIWLRVTKAWYGSPILFISIWKFIIFTEYIGTHLN